MIEQLKIWWSGRSLREQRMLLLMLALLAVVLVWLLILGVSRGLSDARERHSLAVIEHARVAARVDALKALRKQMSPPLGAPVDSVVRQSASDIGFVLSRAEAEGSDRVNIAIASTRPAAFFGWLSELEARGIFPERLTARANSDRTIAVEAVLRGRGQ